MGFFESVFGFSETTYVETQARLSDRATFESIALPNASYPAERCVFTINSHTIQAGSFSAPSLAELRARVQQQLAVTSGFLGNNNTTTKSTTPPGSAVMVRNIVGEARALHSSNGAEDGGTIGRSTAVFQAASQFNLLEFAGPTVTPELGISGYSYDRTQGPACAIACAAGTAYRNYLLPFPMDEQPQQRGQTKKRQWNGLEDLEQLLTEELELTVRPWRVKNGYVESSAERLRPVNKALLQLSPSSSDDVDDESNDKMVDRWMSHIRIGVQEDTHVTDEDDDLDHDAPYRRVVTQTYNSAISIGYSRLPDRLWEPVARLVLNATYEATLLVGLLKTVELRMMERAKGEQAGTYDASTADAPPPPIFLTKIGGGVFKNPDQWILEAIQRAIIRVKDYGVPLDIRIVHFGEIEPLYETLSEGHDTKEDPKSEL